VGKGGAGDLHHPEEVQLHDVADVSDGLLFDRADMTGAGIVDHRVESAMLGEYAVNGGGNRSRVRDIELPNLDLVSDASFRSRRTQGVSTRGVA